MKPNLFCPNFFTTAHILVNIIEDGIVYNFPFCITMLIFSSGIFANGVPLWKMEDTSSAAALTGHIILLPVLSFDHWCVMMSSCVSLFCHSNVMETEEGYKYFT